MFSECYRIPLLLSQTGTLKRIVGPRSYTAAFPVLLLQRFLARGVNWETAMITANGNH